MSKAIQFCIILMIPFMLISFSSNAQCDRHGDGNKPKYYFAAIEAADESEAYKTDSTKVYQRLGEINVCELEAFAIAMAQLNKKSQFAYVENLIPVLGKNPGTIILNKGNYDLIFAKTNQQLASYKTLYKLLAKSQFPTDREMGKAIKTHFQGTNQQVSEETRRGAVLGILIAGLGSMDENAKYQKAAINRGAFMGAFFAELAGNSSKISFTNWKSVKTELYNLPNPYAVK